jgi:methionyl-tRNA formyltransferase
VKVAFWGTPDFALPSLRALIGEDHEVAVVITQPDRPAGRGRALRQSPVKLFAVEECIPVLQPERARGPEFIEQLARFEPDISVVVAFGQILNRDVLVLPGLGSINVHASLLPALRGAAPINWSIMRGLQETGVTIMRMDEKLDSGAILLQVREPIGPEETADDLTERLSELGAEALVESLALLDAGMLPETVQDHSQATFAPKLLRENSHIDWSCSAGVVDRTIRGLDSVPGAWSTSPRGELKLYRPHAIEYEGDEAPGTVVDVRPNDPSMGLLVAAGTGAVWVREVKPAGKRRMTSVEWLRGRSLAIGDLLA